MLENVSFLCDTDIVGFARLCSAVVATRTTSSLALLFGRSQPSPDMQTRIWELIALGLFSKQAQTCSSITSVSVFGLSLSEADAEAIAAVLTSQDSFKFWSGSNINDDHGESDHDEGSPGNGARLLTTGWLKQGTSVTLERMAADEELPEACATCLWQPMCLVLRCLKTATTMAFVACSYRVTGFARCSTTKSFRQQEITVQTAA